MKIDIGRRVRLLKLWLWSEKHGVSFPDLLNKLFDPPCAYKAKPFIMKIDDRGEGFLRVYLKGLDSPLFFPSEMPTRALFHIVSENFCRENWHYYETDETRVAKEDVVVDCGAAEGLFSLSVASRCKKVYAVEPLSIFIASMRLTFSKFNNVEIIPCGLSDERGEAAFAKDGGLMYQHGKNLETEKAPVDTIDNLFFKKGVKVDYLKADLEGNELTMLNGARDTISAYLPKIAITTYHTPGHAAEISGLLKNLNSAYKIKVKGIDDLIGEPVMLHAWVNKDHDK